MSKQKRHYLPPQTSIVYIEVESSICTGSVVTSSTNNIEINGQSYNENWNSTNDFSDKTWDNLSSTN